MTRIITEKYRCANCNNELARHQAASSSSFFDGDAIFECKYTFTGLFPKLYCCPSCGYIGEDLSKEPDKKIKEIIDSGDYQLLMKIGG